MKRIEIHKGRYSINMDKSKLDINMIHMFLSESAYWAFGRSLQTVKNSIDHSECFGVYKDGREQVGFARIVTDLTTIVWICDLFILEFHQGEGLGKWLVETIVSHPNLKNVRRHMLATKDAHTLYSKYGGFNILPEPDNWMTRYIEDID